MSGQTQSVSANYVTFAAVVLRLEGSSKSGLKSERNALKDKTGGVFIIAVYKTAHKTVYKTVPGVG
jgi:hypothetical protein